MSEGCEKNIANLIFSDASNFLDKSLENIIYENNIAHIEYICDYIIGHGKIIDLYMKKLSKHESEPLYNCLIKMVIFDVFFEKHQSSEPLYNYLIKLGILDAFFEKYLSLEPLDNYLIRMGILDAFFEKHLSIVKSNVEILEEIRRKFDISLYLTIENILIDVFKHQQFIKKNMNDHEKEKIEKIVSSVNENIKCLANAYFTYKISIESSKIIRLRQDVNNQSIEFSENKSLKNLYYIDQNAIAYLTKDYKENQNKKNVIENFFSLENCEYVYSSILLEDAVRMHPFFLNEYRDNFRSLKLKKILVKENEKILVGEEEFATTLKRASLLRDINDASENRYFFKYIQAHFSDKKPFEKKFSLNLTH